MHLVLEAYKKGIIKELKKQEEIIQLKCEIDQLKAEQELDNWLKKTGF